MPAEPEVITSGPLRPLAEVRAETGFAWSCRQGRVENGERTEVHEITSGDRAEYERHMRGHGLKPPKSGYEPWKPWKPPRPAREYAPKPMDPGQRVEWVTVTEAHHENPGHLAADGTYVPPSGAWIEESRQTRTGVIWSVADTATAWWVQPDDDPARPVYVKRAGKSWRDRAYGEGALYEVPGAANAARENVARGEIIRKRGIFPVIAVVFKDSGREQTYVDWHCDPQCPRAAGKDRYDRDRHGPAYGYTASDGTTWTSLHVAQVLTSGEQPPSELCRECVTEIGISAPVAPAGKPPEDSIPDSQSCIRATPAPTAPRVDDGAVGEPTLPAPTGTESLPGWSEQDNVYCPACGAGSIFNGMSGDTPCWLCPACWHEWAAVPEPARAVAATGANVRAPSTQRLDCRLIASSENMDYTLPPDRGRPAGAESGGPPRRTRLTVSLEPPATDAEFLESCALLSAVLSKLGGQIAIWADALAALNLPEPVLNPLRQASDGLTAARAAAVQAAKAFSDEFTGARDVAARGLRFTGQETA